MIIQYVLAPITLTLKIPGYKFPPFRRDRVGKMGGGVVVFVKDHINCKHRPES
jgi:hypothetical protein